MTSVEDLYLGAGGLLAHMRAGALLTDFTTSRPDLAVRIAAEAARRGGAALDAPVSGGQTGAVDATLSIMAGGSAAAFERALPLLQVMGNKVNHMGGIGAGQITKSCNQIATALTTQGIVEAFTLAGSAGIDLARLREVMMGGFANSRALQLTGDKIVRRDFSPGFRLQLYRKDLRIANAVADEASLQLPGTRLVYDEMDALVSNGKADLDFSALVQIFENHKG